MIVPVEHVITYCRHDYAEKWLSRIPDSARDLELQSDVQIGSFTAITSFTEQLATIYAHGIKSAYRPKISIKCGERM